MIDILNTVKLSVAFLCLFAAAEILYRFLKIKVEYTRKLVHVGTGLLTLLFPVLLTSHWNVLLLCASFAAILILSLKFCFLPSVNAIKRKSWGSLCFPAAVWMSFLLMEIVRNRGISTLNPMLFFYLPILVMAFCDPAAALVGRKWPIYSFRCGAGRKSVVGSGTFFLIAYFLTAALLVIFQKNDLSFALFLVVPFLVAAATTLTEAFTPSGFDNLTIPLVTMLCLWAVNLLLIF